MEQQLLIASIAILTQGYTVYVENVQILIRNVKRHQDANVTTYKFMIFNGEVEKILQGIAWIRSHHLHL